MISSQGIYVGAVVAIFIVLLLLCAVGSCMSARSRKQRGLPPVYGTGWAVQPMPFFGHGVAREVEDLPKYEERETQAPGYQATDPNPGSQTSEITAGTELTNVPTSEHIEAAQPSNDAEEPVAYVQTPAEAEHRGTTITTSRLAVTESVHQQ